MKFLLSILYGLAAFALNWCKIKIFLDIDLTLGSFAVMLAIMRLGGRYGLISGILSGICTYFLWDHPWAVVITTCEAFFVALLYSRQRGNLILYDTLYWAVIGMPMAYIFYHCIMGVQFQGTLLIMLKHAINGVFNSLLAIHLCIMFGFGKSSAKERIPYSRLAFFVKVSLLLLPAVLFLVVGMRIYFEKEKELLASRVSSACEIAQGGLSNWLGEHRRSLRTLSAIVGDLETSTALEMQERVEAIKAQTPGCSFMGVVNKDYVTIASSPPEADDKTAWSNCPSDCPLALSIDAAKHSRIPDPVVWKPGTRSPAVMFLSPVIVSGEYKGFCAGVVDISHVSDILAAPSAKYGVGIIVADGDGKVIASTIPDLGANEKLVRPYAENGKTTAEEILHWVPDPRPDISTIERWRDSLFVKTAPVGVSHEWTVVVEAPFLQAIDHLSRVGIHGFVILALLAGLALGLSHLRSKGLVSSIVSLQEVTRSFPKRLDEATPIAWPESNIEEISTLSSNFRDMVSALSAHHAEQKVIEVNLEKSRERYRSIIEAFDLFTYLCSSDYRIEFMNRRLIERIGHDATGELCYKALHGLDSVCSWCTLEKTLKGATVKWEIQSPRDNHWYHVVNTPVRHPDGSVSEQAMMFDISERKIAEDRLRESEERYRLFVETATEGIWAMDAQHHITFANQMACEMLGYKMNELIGLTISSLVFDDDVAEHTERAIPRSRGISERYECRLKRKNGETLWVIMSERVLMEENGGYRGAFAMLTDITQRKKAEEAKGNLEEQLRQAEKMEAVGRLAGGVAHDFNNMLGVILGYTELLRGRVSSGSPHLKALFAIEKAALRSRNITRQLLAFSRKQIISPKPVDLSNLLDSMEKTLLRLIGEDIEFSFHARENLPKVKIDPSQVDQILMNLAINARDAMPQGGRLTIETGEASIDDQYCTKHFDVAPGHYVTLAVTDDGIGMSKETLSHIFEPFFTTKGLGKGTGLGLATVYGIVKQNCGFINAYSEPGQGTTFMIYLPVTPEDSKRLAEDAEGALIPGVGVVLLVEDDEMMREMAVEMLEGIGYTVIPAGSPEEALLLIEKDTVGIDLLLTDVVMPGMSGKDLANRIRGIRPGTKVLFMSGYTSDAIAHRGVLEEGLHFIQKPFNMRDLSRRISELMADGNIVSGRQPAGLPMEANAL